MTETILSGTPAVPAVDANAGVTTPPAVTVTEPAKVEDNKQPVVADDKTPKVEPPKVAVEDFKPYEVKAPDGTELSPDGLKSFNEFVNTNKLPEATAKQMVEWYAKHSADANKAQASQWQTLNDGWVKSAKEDKEYGGDKFDTTVVGARAVISKFAGKEFTEMLNLTGAGNHPEMIRFLHRIHNATKEDKAVQGGQPAGTQPSLAKRLFPSAN